MFKLKVVEPSIGVPDLELRPGLNTVGRVPPNSFQIPDPSVSARHCSIQLSDHSLIVEDLGSLNGTHIDNVPIFKAPLKPGQRLRIGGILLDVIPAEPAVSETASAPALPAAVRQVFPAGYIVIPQTAVAAPVATSSSVMRVVAAAPVAPSQNTAVTPVAVPVPAATPPAAEPLVRVATYLLKPPAPAVIPVETAPPPPPIPVPDGCKKHVDRPAELICLPCQSLFCLECAPPRKIGSRTRYYCPLCNGQCRNLAEYRARQAALAARAKLTFWQRVLGRFKHPFSTAGLWLIGSGSAFYCMLADV